TPCCRRRRSTSSPGSPGRSRSRMIASKRWLSASPRAASPSRISLHACPASEKPWVSDFPITGSSSTTSNSISTAPSVASGHVPHAGGVADRLGDLGHLPRAAAAVDVLVGGPVVAGQGDVVVLLVDGVIPPDRGGDDSQRHERDAHEPLQE